MQYEANTPEEYIAAIPEERRVMMQKLRTVIKTNLPKGFREEINYKMIGYIVPHSLYPNGYHCNPKLPLSFINIASQKNFIAVYHSGIYADPKLMNWFVSEYPKYMTTKLDMGKSCIRFKNINKIPLELIGKLATKMTVQDWIQLYEQSIQNRKK